MNFFFDRTIDRRLTIDAFHEPVHYNILKPAEHFNCEAIEWYVVNGIKTFLMIIALCVLHKSNSLT